MTHAPEYLPLVIDAAAFGFALVMLWLLCAARSTKQRDEAALGIQGERLGRLERGRASRTRGQREC